MSVQSAIAMIESLVAQKTAALTPFSATVTALSGGKVQIKRLGSATADTQFYARLTGFSLTVGDEVACISLLGSAFVLGKTQRAAATSFALDASLVGEVIHAVPVYQDASDTASTVSTSTYQQACALSFVLPAGTWTVTANGTLRVTRSAAGAVNCRTNIDGTDGGGATIAVDASVMTSIYAAQQLAAVSGGRTITIVFKFKNNSAATCTAAAPMLMAIAKRTA
jgi:hypothetical protein